MTAKLRQVAAVVPYDVDGKPLHEAATEAGVDRGTLYRWRTQDVHFMAALNAWRNETQSHARDRMLAMADKAIGAVARGLDDGAAPFRLAGPDAAGDWRAVR